MSKEFSDKDENLMIEYDDEGICRVLVYIDVLNDHCDLTHWLMDLSKVRISSKNQTPEEKLTVKAWNLYQTALESDACAGSKDTFIKPEEAI
jgi:hypothetical protein